MWSPVELVIDGKAQVLCFRCDLQNLARDGLIIRPLLVMRIKSLRLPYFLKSGAFLSVLLTGNLSVHYRQSSAKSLVVYLTQDGKLLMKTRNNLTMDQALCTGILQVLQEQLMISPHQKLLDSFYQQGSF